MYKITLKIAGMMCGMCESHINETVRRAVPGAKKVASSHGKGECTFLSDDAVDESALRKAIEDTGYTLVSLSSEPYKKKGLLG